MAQDIIGPNARALYDLAYVHYETGFLKSLTNTKTWWQKLAMEMPSSSGTEVHEWLGNVLGFTQWKSERRFRSLGRNKYALANKDWEGAGTAIPRNAILDGALATFANTFKMAGVQIAKFPDRQVADLMKNGHTAGADYKCYDGQPFFSTSHPVDTASAGAGTFGNYLTGTALTSPNLNAGLATFATLPDENGDVLGLAPNILAVPPALRATALEIVKSTTITNSGNTAGVTNINQDIVEVMVIPELAGSSSDNKSWYLIYSGEMMPFIRQVRTAAMFLEIAGIDSEHCRMNKEVLLGADAREAYGYTLPQFASKFVGP